MFQGPPYLKVAARLASPFRNFRSITVRRAPTFENKDVSGFSEGYSITFKSVQHSSREAFLIKSESSPLHDTFFIQVRMKSSDRIIDLILMPDLFQDLTRFKCQYKHHFMSILVLNVIRILLNSRK